MTTTVPLNSPSTPATVTASTLTTSPPSVTSDVRPSVDYQEAMSSNVLVIALAVGAVAAFVIIVGVIVCCVRTYRKQQEKCQKKQAEMGANFGTNGPNPGGVQNMSYATENVYTDARPAPSTVQPMVMDPAALDANGSAFSTDRVLLNRVNDGGSTSTPAIPEAPITSAAGGRQVLNPAAPPPTVQQQAPIVPEQAVLLYPSLPTANNGPIYPNLGQPTAQQNPFPITNLNLPHAQQNPFPTTNLNLLAAQQNPYPTTNLTAQNPYFGSNPVTENTYSSVLPRNPYPTLPATLPGAAGYSNGGTPGRVYADASAVNPGTSTLPARGGLGSQVTADGFTVYPSSGMGGTGY